jgi:hypothetical protein
MNLRGRLPTGKEDLVLKFIDRAISRLAIAGRVCWSACSLEHLGSLAHGTQFIRNAMKVLKPGGVAIHTTEFNLTSNDATIEHQDLSLYRRRDVDALVADLISDGHTPSAVDYEQGQGYAETVVDLPPFGRGEPHLRLRIADFDSTSIGLIIQKGGG